MHTDLQWIATLAVNRVHCSRMNTWRQCMWSPQAIYMVAAGSLLTFTPWCSSISDQYFCVDEDNPVSGCYCPPTWYLIGSSCICGCIVSGLFTIAAAVGKHPYLVHSCHQAVNLEQGKNEIPSRQTLHVVLLCYVVRQTQKHLWPATTNVT